MVAAAGEEVITGDKVVFIGAKAGETTKTLTEDQGTASGTDSTP